jgi:hypothetical protein
MRSFLIISAFAFVAACGGHEEENYDNLGDCVTDHVAEGLPEAHAITHCLVDYDFAPDFTTEAECVAWVTDHGGYPDSRDEACADYIAETGQ